jgi:GDP-L-fucose synthase
MKFFYENIKNNIILPNGNVDEFAFSEFDYSYGLKNPIFELTDYSNIIICVKSNNKPLTYHFLEKNEEYFKSLFKKIENKSNVKLVITNTHEGEGIYHFLKKLAELKNEYSINRSQIIIVTLNSIATGDDPAAAELKRTFTIISKPFLLYDLSANYNKLEETEIIHNGSKIRLCTVDDYLNTDKSKFFLSYNKNCTKSSRIKFMLWLIKNKLIDDTLYSLLITKPKFEISREELLVGGENKELKGIWEYYGEFEKIGYNKLDWDYKNNKNDVYSSTMYTSYEHYASTLFSVITETTHDNLSLNLTEKSFKSIANCHPFLIVGDTRVNEKLKEFGFKLYDDLIDYSFDSVYDNNERLDKCLIEIKRIYSLGANHILEWYRNNIDKIEYNRELFMSYGKSRTANVAINEIIKGMKTKKVLITGSNGLVGIHLVKKCIEQGYDVIGVDKSELSPYLSDLNFKFYKLDLTIEENLINIFKYESPDAVFNCFGIKGSPIRAKEHPVDFLYPSFKINTEIINQCAKNNIWLVFVSSVGVYGPSEKFEESSMWKTLPSESDWYPSWSKRMGEILLESYKVQYNYTNWSIIRPSNIFGEYDNFNGTGTVIATQCKKISEAENEIECWGDGTPIRDFVYAGDVASAILKLYSDKIHTVINFGSGEEVTIKDMVNTLIEISGKKLSIKWDTSKPNGDLRRQMDIEKQIEFNLLPTIGLKKALELTYNHYQAHPLLNITQ